MGRHQGKHKLVRARRRGRVPRAALVAAPLAFAATGAAVGLGLQGAGNSPDVIAAEKPSTGSVATRQPLVSRSGRRPVRPNTPDVSGSVAVPLSPVERALQPQAVRRALSGAADTQWTTTELNIWTRPDDRADQLGVLDAGVKVRVTGRRLLGRDEVVLDGRSRWVTTGYLSAEKPPPEPSLGGQCGNGTTVPAGVSPNIRAIHEAVCANFPEITTYGSLRSDGEHAQGIAMDIMVTGDRGWEVAEFIRKYSSELGVNYVIHARRIWSVQRSAEGWRPMADRGSVTANHFDHVHVTTY